MRRLSLALFLLSFLLLPALVYAQDTPQPVREAAITDLNRRIPNIGRPQAWRHVLLPVNDSNLGCSLVGVGSGLSTMTEIYVVTLTYPAAEYTYHISLDATQVIACDTKLLTNVIPVTPANPNTGVIGTNPSVVNPAASFTSTTCPANFTGYAYPRLYVGATGQVEGGDNINNIMRQNYGRSSQPTGTEIPPGGVFQVLGGPECTGSNLGEAILWWQVSYNGVTGWTAESLNGDYFLELVGGAPIPGSSTATLPTVRQALVASELASVRELGQLQFPNDIPLIDLANNGLLAVGSQTGVVFYTTTGNQLTPTNVVLPITSPNSYGGLSPVGDRAIINRYTASGTNPSTQGFFFNTSTGAEVGSLPALSTGALRGTILSPNGNFVVVYYETLPAVAGFKVQLYDLAQGMNGIVDLAHNSPVVKAAFSPDNKFLATYSSTEDIVTLWDVATRTNLGTLNVDVIPAVNTGAMAPAALAFSPNSQLLAVGGESGTVQLWDVATRTLKTSLTAYQPNQASVLSVAFSPDGKLLVAGGGFLSQAAPSTVNNLVVFDLTTNTPLASLVGHTNLVLKVLFSTDGSFILSSSSDGTVRVWAVAR